MGDKDQRLKQFFCQIEQDKNNNSVSDKGKIIEKNQDNENVYKRQNGESLTDSESIKSCKDEQNRDIIDNGRLGSYDEYGNYFFIPQIRQELIDIPKIIYSSKTLENGKLYDMRATIPIFGDLLFRLKINKYEAVLLLVENVVREAGQYVEVYEEIVDNLALSESEPLPLSIIFRIFNIYEDSDDYGKKYLGYSNFENILLRKVYMGFVAQKINERNVDQEIADFYEMVEILKNGGEYGKRVLSNFSQRMDDRMEIFDIQDKQYYARSVNQILLASIDFVTTKQDKEDKQNCEVYKKVLAVRNRKTKQLVLEVQKEIDENYVKQVVTETKKASIERNEQKLADIKLRYFEKLTTKPKTAKKGTNAQTKHTLEKPIIKQIVAKRKLEQNENLTKEEKIKKIIEKKDSTQIKKVEPSKVQKQKAGAKKAKKKPSKPKKKAKKKVAKASAKPESKSFSAKKGGKKGGGKADSKKPAKKDDKKKDEKKELDYQKQYLALLKKRYETYEYNPSTTEFVKTPIVQQKVQPTKTVNQEKDVELELIENGLVNLKEQQDNKKEKSVGKGSVKTEQQEINIKKQSTISKTVVEEGIYIDDIKTEDSLQKLKEQLAMRGKTQLNDEVTEELLKNKEELLQTLLNKKKSDNLDIDKQKLDLQQDKSSAKFENPIKEPKEKEMGKN